MSKVGAYTQCIMFNFIGSVLDKNLKRKLLSHLQIDDLSCLDLSMDLYNLI